MFSLSIHDMRVEAHSRNGHVWLDLLPDGQTSMYPRLTVFIETENLLALRRELDEIAGALAPGGRSVEQVQAERVTA